MGAAPSERAACADLYVDPSGRPGVGQNGAAHVIGLPEVYTTPIQDLNALPPQLQMGCFQEKPVDELLVGFASASGFRHAADKGASVAASEECMQVFPTCSRNHRSVEVPTSCAAEHELLRRVLAGAQPLQ